MCTLDKRGNLFILTLTGEGEHRLNPSLIDSIRSALSQARSQATASAGESHALVTIADGRFFSNGFDLAWAQSAGSGAGFKERLSHMVSYMKPLVADLISLPMPTIAAVTGHAAAAGFMLALSHDYFLMTKGRPVLYMSELDIGMTFPEYFTVVFGEKLASPAARRDVLLKASKVKAEEALAMRIVDSAHDSTDATIEAAVRLGEQLVKRKWNGEIYGEIRKSLYPLTCKQFGLTTKEIVAPRL